MGLFYTNVTLYKAHPQRVVDLLKKLNRTGFVSPSLGNFIVYYDKETEDQNTRILMNLTKKITRKMKCTGLASLVHDSDLYLYWLYNNGKLIDTYNSLPNYFDSEAEAPTPEGGDVNKLCAAFDKPESESEISRIFELVEQGNLDFAAKKFLLGEDIHGALVKALGMPPFSAFVGYYTIENADLPIELDRNNLVKL